MKNIEYENDDLKDTLAIPLYGNILELKNNNELCTCNIDYKKFQSGINEISKMCGEITALVNVGIDPHRALDFLQEKYITEIITSGNLDVAKINANAAIESSKNELLINQKNII